MTPPFPPSSSFQSQLSSKFLYSLSVTRSPPLPSFTPPRQTSALSITVQVLIGSAALLYSCHPNMLDPSNNFTSASSRGITLLTVSTLLPSLSTGKFLHEKI